MNDMEKRARHVREQAVTSDTSRTPFDSMCDRYEARLGKQADDLVGASLQLRCLESQLVCVSHGGHEFESIDTYGMGTPCKKCKYCGKAQ